MIREKARRSRSLKNLSDAAERAWWRLTVTCDDHGRFDAEPDVLLSQLFERRPRGWTTEKMAKTIEEWTQSFADASQPLIHLYRVPGDDGLYGHVVSFVDHQRERDSKPKYPDPPCGGKPETSAKCRDSLQIGGDLPQTAASSGSVSGAVIGAVAGAGSDAREPRAGAAAGKGKGNGVDPDIRTWLLATKHLGTLAEDRHADLWATLEKAYDQYEWLFFETEIAKADAWIVSHPAKRPTPRGLPAFIRYWLDKAVEIGRRQRG
jgi:hypothetical protein